MFDLSVGTLRDFSLDSLTFSTNYVSSARGESNYDDDNTDWQSENHKQGSGAKGCAFVECIVNKN